MFYVCTRIGLKRFVYVCMLNISVFVYTSLSYLLLRYFTLFTRPTTQIPTNFRKEENKIKRCYLSIIKTLVLLHIYNTNFI